MRCTLVFYLGTSILKELEKNKLDYLDGNDAFVPFLKTNMTKTEFEDFKNRYFNTGEHLYNIRP